MVCVIVYDILYRLKLKMKPLSIEIRIIKFFRIWILKIGPKIVREFLKIQIADYFASLSERFIKKS